ncbi:MAG: MarR family transcriptional regulator, partial [Rhodocyclaceae bacterium]|nr:MarR family transcriptional regulator [Rhodocyclaceae bacterium]
DRRAYIVKLTKEGRRVFREWADEHEDWIIRLFEGLGEKDRGQLYALLARLKQHVLEQHPEG